MCLRPTRPSRRPGAADPDHSTILPEHLAAMHRRLDPTTHDGRSVSSPFPPSKAAA